MGRSSNPDKFLALKDKNGVSVGSLARPNSPGVAMCKVCDLPVNFNEYFISQVMISEKVVFLVSLVVFFI